MLAYFPSLYPDEIIYSGIARYHLMSGNRTQKQTIFDLFGSRLVCATADLPSHLSALAARSGTVYTTEELIKNHTLYPYYTSYGSKDKAKELFRLMAEGSNRGESHVLMGIPACKIKLPTKLKYCSSCYQDDTKKYGEPYWHRCHQLPGVHICPMHKSILKVSTVEYSTLHHKFSFVSLTNYNESDYTEPVVDSSWLDYLTFIAVQSNLLLHSQQIIKEESASYRKLPSMEGYRTVGGRVRINRLIQNFRNSYTDKLLEYLDCGIDSNSSDTWLHKIIRNQEEITHPLRHLLIFGFLEKSVAGFSVTTNNFPFGNGPWPCLNKAADHYNQMVIDKCVVTRCSTTTKPVGTFHCNCGFIYSRRGPDTCDEDMNRIGRIKNFGSIWLDKLKCLNESSITLRQKAKILGVDPGTVKNQTELLNSNKAALRTKKNQNYLARSKRNRNNEKGFLQTKVKRKVDWNQRDEILYVLVVETVGQMKRLPNPERISLASIARHTDLGQLKQKLIKNLNKLPKTNEFINKHIDSTEAYQIRRLIWAANRLHEVEGRMSGWRVLKLAGLNHPLRKEVEIKFMELLR
ncbi:TnsD family Tn7-like transposition protein [Paenibacillus sp. FSL H8-0537]|uniref:TnsD family Tn7-like transposition protein n=1 Tax=Paenibacillus sp. FSL H8-0537 TaxID=2921399 RepID=UPI003101A200